MPFAMLLPLAFLFEAPAAAAAVAGGAVSIPIIIHLLNRRRFRIVQWAAMRFLLNAQRKNSRRLRIEQLLLLAVRCLLLLLLALAMISVTGWAESLWHWFGPGLTVAAGTARTHKVLVVDGSLGMGLKAGDGDCFDRAKDLARRIVRESGGGDGFSVVLLASPPRMVVPGPSGDDTVGEPSDDVEKVVARIDELRCTQGNADLAAALNTVENILEASPNKYAEREVYFLSNLQKTTWIARQPAALSATLQKIQAKAHAVVVDAGEDVPGNLAVDALVLADPVAAAGRDTLIQAALHDYGETRSDVAVRLLVGKVTDAGADGSVDLRQVAETKVAIIKGGEQARATLKYRFPDAGDYVVQVEADHDGLEADDVRRALVTVKTTVPVLLVNGKPAGEAFDQASEYVSVALNPFKNGSPPPEANILARPKVILERDFADEGLGDLTPYDCVFLCDVPRFSEGEAKRLLAHVRRGGGVVVSLGDRVDPAAYNEVLFQGGAGLLPARLVGKQSDNEDYSYQFLPEPDADKEPPLKAFRDSRPREMLLSARFHEFFTVEPALKGSPRRLLSFTAVPVPGRNPDAKLKAVPPPGGPALLEWRPTGGKEGPNASRLRGRVVLLTTTVNADWNSWPASPSFPPFVNNLMHFAAAGRLREQAVEVGEPLELYLSTPGGGAVTIHTPDGRDVAAQTRDLDEGSTLRWTEADVGGVYRVSAAGQRDSFFAVNPPAFNEAQQASPSDLARAAAEDLKTTYPDWEVQVVKDPHDVVHAAGAATVAEPVPYGPFIARILLLIVLALFFCEVVLAWVFGHYSAVPALEEEAARAPVTAGRWALTTLPWYVASGLLLCCLMGVFFILVHNAWTGDFLGFLPDGLRRWMESGAGVAPPAEGEASHWRLESSALLWGFRAGPWLTALVFLAGATLILVVYFNEGRRVSTPYRLLLAGLRLGLLLLLLLVILPQLRVWYERQAWPDVVILIDDSYSMSTKDHYRDPKAQAIADALASSAGVSEPDRLRLAQALLTRRDPDWPRTLLKRKARLHVYHCSSRAHRLAGISSADDVQPAVAAVTKLEALETNDSTQLGAAVRQVLGEFNASSLAAIVVLTDGVTTEGENLDKASEFARDQGVPLFLVGIGDAEEVKDLRLHDLQAVDSVYVNDRVIFEVNLSGKGYAGLTVPVTLKEKGKDAPLDSKNVTVKASGDDLKVLLEHRPTEPGEKSYVIDVPVQPDEVDKENNHLERKVYVREAKLIKVLYVEGYRRYEYHFLKTLLERESNRTKGNKSMDLKVVLLEADPDFATQDRSALSEIPTKEELKAYDVILLGDVDPRPKDGNKMTEHLKDMAEWVQEHGGGLLMVAGERYAPFAYKDSPLKDVLPIDILVDKAPDEGAVERTEGYRPELTPEGRRHPIFRFSAKEGEDEEVWKHLKEMYWWADGYVPKRAAEVLAVHPKAKAPVDKDADGKDRKRDSDRQPLVVQQFVGAGRSMFLGFDETWRWGFREDQQRYNQFWIQTVRYLSGSRRDRVELHLDREEPYRRGEPIKMTVRFPDDAPPPGPDVSVKVVVERRPSRGGEAVVRTVQLTRVEGSRASYSAVLTQTPEGLYAIWLSEPNVPNPKPSAECKVLAPPGEMEQLRMNQTEMERAAEKSHGRFYTLADADELPNQLPVNARVRLKAPSSKPWSFWTYGGVFYLIALLALTTEWVLRKRKNLV